ncbi:hypothetical protein P7C71_g717, partial [Lecanoromycetidae sp. Uapishka_2]
MLLLGLVLGLSIGLTRPAPQEALGPVVDLGYTKYQGDTYPGGISQWLGVRYAQPPVGNLRFAAPLPVMENDTLQIATKRGSNCIGTRASLTSGTVFSGSENEDCLNLDIYAPANVTSTSKLPVYFFMQGGGFNTAYPTQNGSSLVQASEGTIMVVSINYRVSAYGFLSSSEVQKGGSLNNGLKDQRMALTWINQNIAKFGGDPGHVILGGASAGAGSVTLQLAAYGGRQDNLFHGSIAESQSFGALRTVDESQYQYDELVGRTNCGGSNDTLACLRGLDITTLQTQNIMTRFPNTTADPLFAYNPTLDHDFIQCYTMDLFNSGRYLKLPAIYGDVSNEGTVFVPKNETSTIEQSNAFLQAQFPLLNDSNLDTIQSLYPPEYQGYSKIGNAGQYWRSTSDAYGDQRYVCPGFFMNNVSAHYASKNPTAGNWNYHYNVTDPGQIMQGLGVPHVAEQSAIWGDTNPASYKTTNAPIIPLMQAYWISFIQSFDPNTNRAPGAPTWDDWGTPDPTGGKRLLVQNPDASGGVGTTVMELIDDDYRHKCATLGAWAVAIKQ